MMMTAPSSCRARVACARTRACRTGAAVADDTYQEVISREVALSDVGTQLMKPLTGIGAAAVVAGLGLSFLSAIGYKRNEENTQSEPGPRKEQ